MHEASLMANLMKKIKAVARQGGAKRILSVSVKLGALSHMSPEHFREHFAVASRGSIAEGAALKIEVLDDLNDPHAQDILLANVEVAD